MDLVIVHLSKTECEKQRTKDRPKERKMGSKKNQGKDVKLHFSSTRFQLKRCRTELFLQTSNPETLVCLFNLVLTFATKHRA